MKAQLAWFGLCLSVFGGQRTFEVRGRVEPAAQGAASLHATASAFAVSTLVDSAGTFRFTRIDPGSYTVIVFLPGRGETRNTIDVGPGTADAKNRVGITVRINEALLTPDAHAKVSVRELAIPDRARNEAAAADRALARKDREGAVAHLKKAVELAPQFSAAWNHLGTLMYKNREYEQAAEYFRRSLVADPKAFEPLVNLGGVLLNLNQLDEAWKYNLLAVLHRPNDALANSQLGMTYFEQGKADLALRYLNAARKLDPGHFSLPQLMAAEIYLRRQQNAEAAEVMEEFLRYHPDWPQAAKMREAVASLRGTHP